MSQPKILFISFEFRLPFAHSLKEKRQPLKSLKERVKHKFNASVAEIDAQDEWQRAIIGVCMLSADAQQLERQMSQLENFVLESTQMEIVNIQHEWL